MSRDTFTRSTAFGMGTGYTWTDQDSEYANASDSDFFVDGEKFVLPAEHWDSYLFDTPAPPAGTVQFDIWLPAQPNYTGTYIWPEVALRIGTVSDFDVALYLVQDYNGTDPIMKIGKNFTSSTQITITPDNWYTAKMAYDTTVPETRYKLWKRGDPEPGWQRLDNDGNAQIPETWLDILWTGDFESYIDNIVVEDTSGYSELTLDASISSGGGVITQEGSFTLNAWIKGIITGALTMDALIGVFTFPLTLDALVVTELDDALRHHRYHDHESVLPSTRVILDEPVGPYPTGTDLHTVLAWLWKRVVR